MKTAKWGIIGTGQIANAFVKDFKHVKNGEIISVYGRNQQRLTEFTQKHGITMTYNNLDEMLSDEQLDVVYIGTTNNSHYDLALKAIHHGKAVLLEKPFTLNEKRTSALIEAAKTHDVFIMEALWTLFSPTIAHVMKWLEEGAIGKIVHITANFSFKGDGNLEGRLYNKTLGGGSLLDVGIYPLLIFQYIAKSTLQHVHASANMTAQGVDEFTTFHLTYENGMTASGFSGINFDSNHECVIYGENGSIHIPNFWMPTRAELRKEGNGDVYTNERGFGYHYEATEVSKNVLRNENENKVVSHEFTQTLSSTMDTIRKLIGVEYSVD